MKKKRKLKEQTKKGIYIAIGIFLFILLYALKNTSYFVRVSTFVFFILMFFLIDYFFEFKFKKQHYVLVLLIAITSILLSPLYYIYPLYDKILHFIIPILICILAFFLINKLNTKFSIKLAIAFFVVVSLLSLFEVGEYVLDQFFDLKLQGVYTIDKFNILMDRNDDTMMDLILGTIGSLILVAVKTATFHYKKIKKKLKKKIKL